MPQVLNLGDILRLRVVCYTANQVGVNTVHYKVIAKAGAGQTDAQVAVAIDTTLEPRYKTILSVGARYRGCSIQRIAPGFPTLPATSFALDGPGLVLGDMLAGQVSGIISSRTNLAGPKYRGRAYIPFPGETDNAATGVPVAGYVTAIDDIADEFYTNWALGAGADTLEIEPCIWHRSDGTTTPITSYLSRNVWATQRRRGAYGRMNLPPF